MEVVANHPNIAYRMEFQFLKKPIHSTEILSELLHIQLRTSKAFASLLRSLTVCFPMKEGGLSSMIVNFFIASPDVRDAREP